MTNQLKLVIIVIILIIITSNKGKLGRMVG